MNHRLLLAGHHEFIRPSCILEGFQMMKEEILTGIEADVTEMRTKEEYRATPGADG